MDEDHPLYDSKMLSIYVWQQTRIKLFSDGWEYIIRDKVVYIRKYISGDFNASSNSGWMDKHGWIGNLA